MQAAIYRRNYYLIRVNSQNMLLNDQNHEREIYSETARVINEMITHIKTLLFRANAVREDLETFDHENDDIADIDQLMEGFRKFQKGIPLTFFSEYPLDNQMAGAFVLRVIKEMSYWRKHLPWVVQLVNDIDQAFEDQKKSQTENISLIYFMAVKRITADCNDLFRKLRAKLSEERCASLEEEKQPAIFLVPTFRQSHNNQSLKKYRDGLVERMNDMISHLYRGLDVASFQAVDNYLVDITPEDNLELLTKKQARRNRKLKKEIKAYRITFQENQDRRQRIQERKRVKNRKLSNPKASLNKVNLKQITSSNKSLPQKNNKIQLPSIKSLGKDSGGVPPLRKKKTNKQNQKESKFSLEKHREIALNKYKRTKIEQRLKL